MEIGIFGGTFDPIHKGHLAIAQAAIRKYHLDKLLVMPTRVPPHKPGRIISPHYHRLAMVALATKDEPKMVPYALPEDGLNYAFQEVAIIKMEHPNDNLWYLMGMDSFLDLENWKQPKHLTSMVNLIVSHRPGYDMNRVPNNDFYKVVMHKCVHFLEVFMKIAATDIRGALASGDPVSHYLLNRDVREYARKAELYAAGN